jgi:hypothetical protein
MLVKKERASLRALLTSGLFPCFIFAVNLFITWRYMRSGYIDQLPSIEGSFIAIARYVQHHWPAYEWFPLWYGGFPFARVYQPGLHYTVAGFAQVFGLSAPSAYHFVTAITYSLAGVAFYALARALGSERTVAFGGAFFYSVFSPSLLLLSNIRSDAGGIWHARRLQALMVYGEGPNITGLTLGIFALALLYRALTRRSAGSAVAAALAIAAVPATNWPASVALCFGIAACVLAFRPQEIRGMAGRLTAIGAMAICFVLPFALPSTVWSTFHNANVMGDGPSPGSMRWLILALTIVCAAVVRWALGRLGAAYALRFASVYAVLLSSIVLSTARLHINLVPQPIRFHVAMEIPMALAAMDLTQSALHRWPRAKVPAALAVLLFCAVQTYHFRQHSRQMVGKIEIAKTLEYQEARWFAANMQPGQRVAVPGTVSFWLNSFGETPQFTGCCEQSLVNKQNFIAAYVVGAGFQSEAESADYSLLWLKAWAVQAVGIGGPASREAYKAYQYPKRFEGRLPLLWKNGDDFIYRVPEHAAGLARVVRAGDLVRHAPENGIDVKELRPFVAALDDPSLPVASFEWRGSSAARIAGVLTPDEAVSVAVNYDPGWSATSSGKPVTVRPDGLGLIAIEPRCAGACTIDLRWSAGAEPWFAWTAALAALAGAIVWWKRDQEA